MSPRDRILARRATFVAAALAALPISSAACSKTDDDIGAPTDQKKTKKKAPSADAGAEPDVDPIPCLTPVAEDTGPEVAPMPCLSPPPFDAGAPHPKVCLSIVVPKSDAGPKPCLKVDPGNPLPE